MLIEWGLQPIILAEQPHMGRTLIEKLLHHKLGVGYAFVLMTPDDVGASQRDFGSLINELLTPLETNPPPLQPEWRWPLTPALLKIFKPRARQNVIFEYGVFIGHLGREKVCLLKKGDVDFPTDILGLGYIPFRENVSEKECKKQIKRELEAAGYELKSQRVVWDVGPISPFQINSRGLKEILDKDLPPEILAEVKRLSESPRTLGRVRVFRDKHGTYTIKYDEVQVNKKWKNELRFT